MTEFWIVCLILFGVIALQQYVILKLTDKVMSRNYFEYEQAKGLNNRVVQRRKYNEVPDDLGPLNELGV